MVDDKKRRRLPQPHGGTLTPWAPGQSRNPAGRPRNRIATMLFDVIADEATASALLGEYLRLCKSARSEDLRARMLQDLLDRIGLPRMAPQDENGNARAVATVVNIIRPDASELGI